jgi:transcriptional regulator GlxA family with amidase domain
VIASSSGVAVETLAVARLPPGDVETVLVVGAERDPLLRAMEDPDLRAAIPRLATEAVRFGSVCTGGFLLAAIGLLDGHRVSTHWDSSEPFVAAFPNVTVDADALYLVDGDSGPRRE